MARLINRLLGGNVAIPEGVVPETPALVQALLQNLREAQIIVADNVAEYLYAGAGQDVWDVAKDFPGLVPPFEKFYIEYRLPPTIRGSAFGTVDLRAVPWKSVGAFVVGARILGDWATAFTLFVEPRDGSPPLWHPMLYTLRSDPQGNVAIGSRSKWLDVKSWYSVAEAPERTARSFSYLYPCLLAISFMNCRNVERVLSPSVPDKLLQANRKRHPEYRPPVRYTTLHIKPIQTILETEGLAGTAGLKHALHICRGHFKDYTEHGLFGSEHHRGRYWWSAHVRGQASDGAVLKTYQVDGPAQPDPRRPTAEAADHGFRQVLS